MAGRSPLCKSRCAFERLLTHVAPRQAGHSVFHRTKIRGQWERDLVAGSAGSGCMQAGSFASKWNRGTHRPTAPSHRRGNLICPINRSRCCVDVRPEDRNWWSERCPGPSPNLPTGGYHSPQTLRNLHGAVEVQAIKVVRTSRCIMAFPEAGPLAAPPASRTRRRCQRVSIGVQPGPPIGVEEGPPRRDGIH